MQSGLHGESRPEGDHAEKFVDDLVGVGGAGPPDRGLEIVARKGVNDDFTARGI